jgi:Fic family protein
MFEPRYLITHTILKNIGRIEGSKALIAQVQLAMSSDALMRDEARQRMIHHGTSFEGNDLTLAQVKQINAIPEAQAEPVAQATGIFGRDRDIQEVINYRKGLEWLEELGPEQTAEILLSEQVLSELHTLISYRILPAERRGMYRDSQVTVRQARTEAVMHQPPPAVEVPFQLQGLFEWLHSDSGKAHHPVIRAGILHLELMRIQPFVENSGKVARIMALLLLQLEGYGIKRYYSLEAFYNQNTTDYFTALQSVGEGENYDLTYWLEYYTLGMLEELESVRERVLKLYEEVKVRAMVGPQVALSERQIVVLEAIQARGGKIVSADLESVLPMISIDTILRDLKDMVKKGLIKKRGRTKGAYYELVS